MAKKIIVWKVRIGGRLIEVDEKVFINIMHLECDRVHLCEGKRRIAIFVDSEDNIVGTMYCKEV